jgi:D-ribulokinase
MWMDHRAKQQTERINVTNHEALRYVGGSMSPEMQLPKISWIQENLPDTYASASSFLDLADFLTDITEVHSNTNRIHIGYI